MEDADKRRQRKADEANALASVLGAFVRDVCEKHETATPAELEAMASVAGLIVTTGFYDLS